MSNWKDQIEEIRNQRPNLFSSSTVFISQTQFNQLQEIVNATEQVIRNPDYHKMIFAQAPTIAHRSYGPQGVFMGHDFHLCENGPKLIEINTNAGGGLLNLLLARERLNDQEKYELIEKQFFEMFMEEWRRQSSLPGPSYIAIVDDRPQEQFLYPEFKLFKELFQKFGIKAAIAGPEEFQFKNGVLTLEGEQVDMVYNRLTDFYLNEDRHSQIKDAYASGTVVVTPAPYHHALYANKLNLVPLSDKSILESLHLNETVIKTLLNGIPFTQKVSMTNAEKLWEQRKSLFFKPAAGYGSKATYRGDKITHRVWEEILRGEYIAQDYAPPGEIMINMEGKTSSLKVDIRAYVYSGKIQLLAARLYSGQTTNFRTPGGGFAPVIIKNCPT